VVEVVYHYGEREREGREDPHPLDLSLIFGRKEKKRRGEWNVSILV